MDKSTLIVIAALVVFALLKLMRRSRSGGSDEAYTQQDALFTAAERSFLGVLDQAANSRYRVFGKVRVADVITPAKGLERNKWSALFNKVNAKHFDYVLCDPRTLAVKCVIELNDKSHSKSKRSARDEFLRGACESAGLPMIEVPVKRSYSVESVAELLAELE